MTDTSRTTPSLSARSLLDILLVVMVSWLLLDMLAEDRREWRAQMQQMADAIESDPHAQCKLQGLTEPITESVQPANDAGACNRAIDESTIRIAPQH